MPRPKPSAPISLNGASAAGCAARTSLTNSSALRIGTDGVRIARKSCVVASSRPGISFLPATPSTLTAMPRTSGFASDWRRGLPFE